MKSAAVRKNLNQRIIAPATVGWLEAMRDLDGVHFPSEQTGSNRVGVVLFGLIPLSSNECRSICERNLGGTAGLFPSLFAYDRDGCFYFQYLIYRQIRKES